MRTVASISRTLELSAPGKLNPRFILFLCVGRDKEISQRAIVPRAWKGIPDDGAAPVEDATASLMATISTAHLTAEDNTFLRRLAKDRMESGGTDVHVWRDVVPMEGGWLLRIYKDGAAEDDQAVQDAGFSEAFVALIAFWRERNVDWVRLDRDAAVGSLPVFDWQGRPT